MHRLHRRDLLNAVKVERKWILFETPWIHLNTLWQFNPLCDGQLWGCFCTHKNHHSSDIRREVVHNSSRFMLVSSIFLPYPHISSYIIIKYWWNSKLIWTNWSFTNIWLIWIFLSDTSIYSSKVSIIGYSH